MIPCSQCRFWMHDQDHRENYGVCINSEVIEKLKHDCRNLYRFDDRKLERMLRFYDPYVTAKDHRCILGEVGE